VPTTQETITTIRDAAHINAHALGLILDEAQEQFDAIRLWPDSSNKQSLLRQLATTISAYTAAKREATDMEATADEALQSFSSDPVPAPPDYPDIPSAGGVAQWSRRDW
jgi:hypothetical protein